MFPHRYISNVTFIDEIPASITYTNYVRSMTPNIVNNVNEEVA